MLRHAEALDIELQQRANQGDHSGACERADHRAVTAEDRPPTNDDRGNGVELTKLTGHRIEASEVGDVDNSGHGRADRGQEKSDKADPVCIYAGISGSTDVSASRIDLLSERRVCKNHPGKSGDDDHPYRLNADDFGDPAKNALRERDAEMKENVANFATQQIISLRPASELLTRHEPSGEPAGDIEHTQCGNECR